MDLQDHPTGKTPMHVAAGIGYEWGVNALLDANADPSIKDKNNRSVVEYANEKGKLSPRCVQDIRDSVERYMSGLPKHEVEKEVTAESKVVHEHIAIADAKKRKRSEDEEEDEVQRERERKKERERESLVYHDSVYKQSDEAAQAAALPLEKAVKQAIDEDDAQLLYEVLQQHAKMGRIDLIIDNLYDGLSGCSCLHRYH